MGTFSSEKVREEGQIAEIGQQGDCFVSLAMTDKKIAMTEGGRNKEKSVGGVLGFGGFGVDFEGLGGGLGGGGDLVGRIS